MHKFYNATTNAWKQTIGNKALQWFEADMEKMKQ